MLQAPEKYLNSILSKFGTDKDISLLHLAFIKNCPNDLHFIIDEKELNFKKILPELCLNLCDRSKVFDFKPGQRLALLKNPKVKYSKTALKAYLSPYTLKTTHPYIELNTQGRTENLNKYIPISNYKIERAGNLLNRISAFQDIFRTSSQSDFFNNEKLLVIGTYNLFKEIPKEYPACFISESETRELEIEYNSPLLPKISVLKNINLLDEYLQKEINGSNISISTCLFIGSSKFEHSITSIRNHYNQKTFSRVIFIGEKDIKLDLGNNQIPLRWKWTIPEMNFLKAEGNIKHKPIVIHNDELDRAITEFYHAIREIESKHTIGLKSIYRFIRRLYYDWNLKQETTFVKLHQIQQEFDIALKQLLIETLGNIFPDFNFNEYQKPLSIKYAEIIKAIKKNNKSEKLRSYQTQVHQLVLPSFLCSANKAELNELAKQSSYHAPVRNLQDISKLQNASSEHLNNPNRNFYSLTANGKKTEILSYSKSDDSNEEHHKVISSIYGNGKVDKLIERLSRAKSEYKLLLYSMEEKALQYYKDKYHEALNKEYVSADRYEICNIEFHDPYHKYSTFDEWLEDFFSFKADLKETEYYRISFTDNSKIKLPATKEVLKVQENHKHSVSVEDLNVGDKVLIYVNPDKELLRDIIELKNPELMKKADEYSLLWRTCLNDAWNNIIKADIITGHLAELRDNLSVAHKALKMSDPQSLLSKETLEKLIKIQEEMDLEAKRVLYEQLTSNHFSVSELTFKKYLNGEVIFPRSFSDLIIIAKTINDPRLSFDFLKNTMKPKIEEYRGKEIEYGFKFSNSVNQFITTNEADDFISEFLTIAEIEKIKSQIPERTIKDIELITQSNDD